MKVAESWCKSSTRYARGYETAHSRTKRQTRGKDKHAWKLLSFVNRTCVYALVKRHHQGDDSAPSRSRTSYVFEVRMCVALVSAKKSTFIVQGGGEDARNNNSTRFESVLSKKVSSSLVVRGSYPRLNLCSTAGDES